MGGNVGFDESSSNFARLAEQPIIPCIHIPLQIDDRDILYGRGYSSDEDAEQNQHASRREEAEQAERMATGAQASTSTSAEPPLNAPGGGGAEAQP